MAKILGQAAGKVIENTMTLLEIQLVFLLAL